MTGRIVKAPNGVIYLDNSFTFSKNCNGANNKKLICAVSSRIGGVSEGEFRSLNLAFNRFDKKENVKENRIRFASALAIPVDKLVIPIQTHSNIVKQVDEKSINLSETADGLITNISNLPIAILVADCLPVFIYNPIEPQTVAVIHVGWRGVLLNIVGNAIAKLKKITCDDSSADNFISWIGPGICGSCYLVDNHRKRLFSEMFDNNPRIIRGNYIDLSQAVFYQLIKSGLKPDKIFISQHCTMHEEELFFSYRRQGEKSGRMMAVAMIKE